jgi:hypothetical protein
MREVYSHKPLSCFRDNKFTVHSCGTSPQRVAILPKSEFGSGKGNSLVPNTSSKIVQARDQMSLACVGGDAGEAFEHEFRSTYCGRGAGWPSPIVDDDR